MMRDLVHVNEKGSLKLGSDLTSMSRARIESCKREESKELNLKEVEMPRIPSRIGKLKHVTDLNLERNRIKVLEDKPISQLGHIQVLNLGYNEIRVLPDIMNTLGALVTLNVPGNLLEVFPANLKFPNLRALDISRNRIKEIPGSFSESLTDLNFAGSELTTIPQGVFLYRKLRTFDFSMNKLSVLPVDLARNWSIWKI